VLGDFFMQMAVSPLPISSDALPAPDCRSIGDFVAQLLKTAAPNEIRKAFQVPVRGWDGCEEARLCLTPEEAATLVAAALLVESRERTAVTVDVAGKAYQLFAVVGSDGRDISAYIGHQAGDRWTRARDMMVS
jgi:hypothetical protein